VNAPNPFADAARMRKASKLIAQIEREARIAKLDLVDDAELILERVRSMTVQTWCHLAAAACCNPPSPDTTALVVAHFAGHLTKD